MKVVSAEEMVRIETLAFEAGCDEELFMERAGRGVAEWADAYVRTKVCERIVTLLCGKGNNGGDAYVAGRFLLEKGYKVQAFHLFPREECGRLCVKNLDLFEESGGIVSFVKEGLPNLPWPQKGIFIDGLLGTGMKGALRGLMALLVKQVNASSIPTLSVDIPSGVNGESGEVIGDLAIQAEETIFLGLPKAGFFLEQGWNYVGILRYVNFFSDDRYIKQAEAEFTLFEPKNFPLPTVLRCRHKYQAGYVVGIAGSPSMPGAAFLAGMAALRSGAGMTRVFSLEGTVRLSDAPELIWNTVPDSKDFFFHEELQRAKALFMGPGLGTGPLVVELFHIVLEKGAVPLVLDADGLNLFAKYGGCLPPNTILTPHTGEMSRLLGKEFPSSQREESLALCQEYCEEKQAILLLKGAPSWVFSPGKRPVVIPYGTPGLATAGTGDVLSGVTAAFLAQGLEARHAACLASAIHARAGELAAEEKSVYGMIASDVLAQLPYALKEAVRF